ncbi:MAG: hypothetical protein IJ105_03015 [Bacilli bacterium]|nr:hypothetical protein [Bacilli bacterium]
MNEKQKRELARMKKLVHEGKRKFIIRRDRNYLQDLLEIGISEELAWNEILLLSAYDYVPDYRPFFSKNGNDGLTFKKRINDNLVYIKIKIEEYNKEDATVCLSFHIDHK